MLEELRKAENIQIVAMSNKSGDGVADVKKVACE